MTPTPAAALALAKRLTLFASWRSLRSEIRAALANAAIQIESDAALLEAQAKALRGVVFEIRRSHDAGDGHFSTAQVEAVEHALSALPPAGKEGE